ncbi:hypothetical protein AAFN86_10230 [Roseomonas sp. CAU 1739]|uniref:hypothetical protein n=1 Tax=Roseomonas sp. CAU 1739 TaxID=3140364 RepID=UPI00325ABDCB
MDADTILILCLAILVALNLWRLARTIRNCWDGDIEDLYEDVVVRRLAVFVLTAVALVAALSLRGPLRSLLATVVG